jgi:hypothetical protein
MCCRIPGIALASLDVKFEVERIIGTKIYIPLEKRLDAFVGDKFVTPKIGAPERDVPLTLFPLAGEF